MYFYLARLFDVPHRFLQFIPLYNLAYTGIVVDYCTEENNCKYNDYGHYHLLLSLIFIGSIFTRMPVLIAITFFLWNTVRAVMLTSVLSYFRIKRVHIYLLLSLAGLAMLLEIVFLIYIMKNERRLLKSIYAE